jgi:aminoglycoside phosphotransferase (APT) family kinase protein
MEENNDMEQLISWLQEHLPDTEEAAIVHGDYRGHNVLFAPEAPRIAAVLDWELSTIGHPLADLAYCCLPYHLPAEDNRGFQGIEPSELSIPSEEEMLAEYCAVTNRQDLPHWGYFLVFALFRSAAIRAGVFKRGHDGTATNAGALRQGELYRGTAACARRLAALSARTRGHIV